MIGSNQLLDVANPQDMPSLPRPDTPLEAARNGLKFYKELQAEDGHFATEYGGGCHLTYARARHAIMMDLPADVLQVLFSSSPASLSLYTSRAKLLLASSLSRCADTCSTRDGKRAGGDCEWHRTRSSQDDTALITDAIRHTAAPPTVFGTVMNYVSLRLLGMGPDEGPMTEIRALIHKMGEWAHT